MANAATAIRNLPLSQDLLEYYQARVEEGEEERKVLIEKIDECDVAHETMHTLRWELRKKMDEIEDLKRALSDASMYLFDERQQLLSVYAENDELKIQELEDRRHIKHLLALAQPDSQEVTYFPGQPPTRMRRMPRGNEVTADRPASPLGSSSFAKGKSPTRTTRNRVDTQGGEGGGGGRVLRTVYMPSEKTESFLLTIKMLRTQLEEQKRHHVEQMAALKEDRRRAVEEEKVRAAHDRSMIDELTKQNEYLSRLLRSNTREYLTLRHNSQVTQRLMKEDNETLRSQAHSLAQELADVQKRCETEIRTATKRAAKSTESVSAELRKQAVEKETELAKLKEEHERMKERYERELARMKDKTTRATSAHKKLQRQRKSEREGYQNEIKALRRGLAELQADAYLDGRDSNAYELDLLAATTSTAARQKKINAKTSKLKAQLDAVEGQIVRLKV